MRFQFPAPQEAQVKQDTETEEPKEELPEEMAQEDSVRGPYCLTICFDSDCVFVSYDTVSHNFRMPRCKTKTKRWRKMLPKTTEQK